MSLKEVNSELTPTVSVLPWIAAKPNCWFCEWERILQLHRVYLDPSVLHFEQERNFANILPVDQVSLNEEEVP